MPTRSEGFFFLVKPVDFTQPKNGREGKAMLALIKSGFKKGPDRDWPEVSKG